MRTSLTPCVQNSHLLVVFALFMTLQNSLDVKCPSQKKIKSTASTFHKYLLYFLKDACIYACKIMLKY